MGSDSSHGALAFALIYFTFFLDNVLLTVLVPIIPDWVRGEALELWTKHEAPLAVLLNSTVHQIKVEDTSVGGSQAIVGLVLGAKAAAQLLTAPLAGAAVCRHGPARVLEVATVTLAAAATVFLLCSGRTGAAGAWCACAGRVTHGAAAALAGVAGLALAAAAVPLHQRDKAIGALLGAVALAHCTLAKLSVLIKNVTHDAAAALAGVAGLTLAAASVPPTLRDLAIWALLEVVDQGVLVGYPFGGASYALWSPGAPFLLISIALLANLVMQIMFLDYEKFNQVTPETPEMAGIRGSASRMLQVARKESVAACVGAVLLTTSVMASLEPCLPLWIMNMFHPQRWQTGAVFIPDSLGYLVAASGLGGVARKLGAERVALTGQIAVGLAALVVPHATSVSGLALPHAILGSGLGATDAALVPALLARHTTRVPHLAALLQSASSLAYALGPIVGGLLSWCVGFETALRTLGIMNLLYAGFLYRALTVHPLSEQWGASTPEDDPDSEENEGIPLRPQIYTPLN